MDQLHKRAIEIARDLQQVADAARKVTFDPNLNPPNRAIDPRSDDQRRVAFEQDRGRGVEAFERAAEILTEYEKHPR